MLACVCMGRLVFNMYISRGTWYADDAAHVFLVGVIALVVVAVCSACANCKPEGSAWRV